MRTEFARLLKQIRKYAPEADLELVRKAYRVASEAHHGQVRLSGDPFISHSIATARILAGLRLDTTTIAAGLLHDVLEDTAMTRQDLVAEFGEEIASLVDGVTKIGTIRVASTTVPSQEEKQAQSLRKMLVATARDVRVLLIKLADRLHNMRTIQFLPDNKVQRISRDTLDIYAPLANRLGISQWRWELEDHAFHRLHPVEYKEMAAQVNMKRREREEELRETVAFLEKHLAEAEINASVTGRAKHLYGIYQKMLRQAIDFEEVMDMQGVRIITQSESECYNAVGIVHSLWPPVPGRFKDYIAVPKENMYQSIHTTVMRENGRTLDVQIRTEEMDRRAREGIAAHWRYKEGARDDPKTEAQLHWLRKMYEWLQDDHAPAEMLDSVRRDFMPSEIYVFTPRGEVKELPAGATPLDFAYKVHSAIGHQCIGARVNGRIVPLRYNLQIGDVVEILTSKNQTPHRDWLDMVVTGKARSRIRQRLRELGELDDLETADGTKPSEPREVRPTPPKPTVRQVDDATREKLLRVEGARGMAAQFAKCCNPMPGQPIFGYATRGSGITIHRVDCRNFPITKRDPERVIAVSWEGEGHFETAIRVTIGQRPNVLGDITNAIRPINVNIVKAEFSQAAKNGKSHFEFVFEATARSHAERVARTLNTVAGVAEVKILSTREVPPST
ncbi:MAG TPA: bifunctional (p)ppGpp synthetase/guanosine-3',5'-bis(diphosphate) 3'-pyrophosphohydrolase [Candidatus Hydrogenedentes bacterium]|nr:bifunctional (p)ppGpp synthetase/guanosine-3',5'-bis(diphosphate) 3'-pyrophosphohydrolase [Candidatus Hydrogenedentota bacterium]HPG68229.1 bifunctional (p)ppGpp synthetase/guanosine-3',5'-bis(diphosphate) 3'-pyrophosphohydrolase [Candidatus Hydrogenedentota bacterium]